MRSDIVPGAVFPDYELSDHRGKHRTLSELQGGDPLVLVLSRGGFCPKDRRQHEGLLQLHREMQYTDPHHNPMIPHTLMLEPGLRRTDAELPAEIRSASSAPRASSAR